MTDPPEDYPIGLTIDYAERSNRLTTVFRVLLALPVVVILALLAGAGNPDPMASAGARAAGTGGFVVMPTILMLLFRRKYPRWWFDWNVALIRFGLRVLSFVLFLRDEYPSADEEQAVHVTIPYPDAARDLNRWLPLVKWLLVLPHVFLLCFLWIIVLIASIAAWISVVFTGRYPRALFDFVVGVMRWSLRVEAYAVLLTTDRYPPFSLRR
jgi:hypothetical protein